MLSFVNVNFCVHINECLLTEKYILSLINFSLSVL